jgi:cytochrome c biogenesis protein CcdA
LSRYKSKKKALFAGLLFALSIFISYFAMWLGLFSALATMTNTFVLKLIVWILGILVWLANLKDYFCYGKVFIMEVPISWRPKMQDLIYSISSPWWAFVIGLLVSVFLLPCSSWPYFTILWYLSAESRNLHTWGYVYLLIYNLIFVLPMVIIVLLVSLWHSTVDKLAKIKHTNTKLIHLIVGLLMLGLWLYVLITM